MRKREGMQKAYWIGMFGFLLLLLVGIVVLNMPEMSKSRRAGSCRFF